jgi:hypothetical protein
MTLDEAVGAVQAHMKRINESYGRTVFDEWAIVAALGGKGRVLHYSGGRREEFGKSFSRDIGSLAGELRRPKQNFGDFEFAREGVGTRFDALMVIGEGLFLICNNTAQSMAGITGDTRWLSAQLPFVELSDTFRSKPLVFPL